MTQIVHVSRLNPKTTEEDFKHFCTRFGNVIECVIFPENDKLSKRSGYVKFSSSQSAEKMYRQSREETFYIDQTSIDIELPRHTSKFSNEKKNSSSTKTIYTLNIEGAINDDNELINYFNSKPLSIKYHKTGAQITFNDKDLVDQILKQNHTKYIIKLLANNSSVKREYEEDQSSEVKRAKLSTLKSHLEHITKFTEDIYEENERLKNENYSLTITLDQQISKSKQLEIEKSDLIESLSKTHDIAKCLTNKFKIREDEHKKLLDESQKKNFEFELIIKTANDALLTGKNEIQRLTNHIITLELQRQELTKQYHESEAKQLNHQQDIEHFFLAIQKPIN